MHAEKASDVWCRDVICSSAGESCFNLLLQVTAAYATARNEVLLQHYGFVDTENMNDFYLANIVEFVKQTAADQPNEENLQEIANRPVLQKALTEVISSPYLAVNGTVHPSGTYHSPYVLPLSMTLH